MILGFTLGGSFLFLNLVQFHDSSFRELLESNSCGKHIKFRREKNRPCLFTPSIKSEIRHFHVVFVQ